MPQCKFVPRTTTVVEIFHKADSKDREHINRLHSDFERAFSQVPPDTHPGGVALGLHQLVDEHVQREVINGPNGHRVQCRKGCSACCRQLVSITREEAVLLAMHVDEEGLEVDLERARRQAAVIGLKGWNTLSPEDRTCVFLAADGSCSVYEHRPVPCRKYFVASDPARCDTEHRVQQVAKVVSPHAEVAFSAALAVFKFGPLPRMMLEVLKGAKE